MVSVRKSSVRFAHDALREWPLRDRFAGRRACAWSLAAALLVFSAACLARAEGKPGTEPAGPAAEKSDDKQAEKPVFEVHQWGVWLADAAIDNINSRSQFPTAMPLRVDTSRPRKLKSGKPAPAPINVLVFRGQPAKLIDIDLRTRAGSFVGHYPPAQSQASNRLRWLDNSLLAAGDEQAMSLKVPEHWFARARASDALTIRKGARSEKFLAYDFDSPFTLPFKLEGGPDKYELHSTSNNPISDVVVMAPTPQGRRIGWLDVLPPSQEKMAAPPVAAGAQNAGPAVAAPVIVSRAARARGAVPPGAPGARTTPLPPGPAVPLTLSAPLAAGSPELAAASSKALAERLERAGLTAQESELIVSLYQSAIFESDQLTVAFRLSPDAVAEETPLVVDPEPAKSVRVTLVVVRNMDPKIIADLQSLVGQLGSARYKERETAEKSLRELGSLAFPALRQAAKHADAEIAFRAQRILFDQQQTLNGPDNAPNVEQE
jgi:hypothetical protein